MGLDQNREQSGDSTAVSSAAQRELRNATSFSFYIRGYRIQQSAEKEEIVFPGGLKHSIRFNHRVPQPPPSQATNVCREEFNVG